MTNRQGSSPTFRRSKRIPAWAAVFLALWFSACANVPPNAPPRPLKPGAVIYGVVPPLFGHAPLRDVTARLDDLQDLGVDAILLSPINATDDESSISYSVTDYFRIRPDFGTLEDLRRLVREADRRGLKVLMDFVPNHTSTAHPFYRDILRKGRASETYDFYERDASGRITHYFDWVGLPNLNYDHPDVVKTVTEAFAYWMEEAGIDGYRVDVAWGPRQRAPGVWGPLIRELREVDPAVVMIAEAGARDPYYIRNGFDLAYDWTDELGHWAWRPAFERIGEAGPLLQEALLKDQDDPETVLRFLNNNDTGARFITRYGPRVTRVAAVLQHTVPGVPLVYTGDEVGAAYEPYEDPPPIAWEDRYGLRGLYRDLAALREALPALHSGDFLPLMPRESPSVYAFLRAAGPDQWALVVLNFDLPERVVLPLPAEIRERLTGAVLKDALSGQRMRPVMDEDGSLVIELEAHAAKILIPAGR